MCVCTCMWVFMCVYVCVFWGGGGGTVISKYIYIPTPWLISPVCSCCCTVDQERNWFFRFQLTWTGFKISLLSAAACGVLLKQKEKNHLQFWWADSLHVQTLNCYSSTLLGKFKRRLTISKFLLPLMYIFIHVLDKTDTWFVLVLGCCPEFACATAVHAFLCVAANWTVCEPTTYNTSLFWQWDT